MAGAHPQRPPSRLGLETLIVLGIGLGQSMVWAILSIINKLTVPVALNHQTTSMNNSVTPDRPWLDFLYQLATNVFLVAPAVVAVYLLARVRRPDRTVWRALGMDARRIGRDIAWGFGLSAAIGIPGLGLYLGARWIGINTSVAPGNLAHVWWAIPMYVLAAFANGALEEITMVGYLLTRWAQCGWASWTAILTSSLIRGGYHLYQGFGGFIGNFIMGLACCWYWKKTHRLWPLIIAHTVLDVVSFVGYALAKQWLPWL